MTKKLIRWRRISGAASLQLRNGVQVGGGGTEFVAAEEDIPRSFLFLFERIGTVEIEVAVPLPAEVEETPAEVEETPVEVEETPVEETKPEDGADLNTLVPRYELFDLQERNLFQIIDNETGEPIDEGRRMRKHTAEALLDELNNPEA